MRTVWAGGALHGYEDHGGAGTGRSADATSTGRTASATRGRASGRRQARLPGNPQECRCYLQGTLLKAENHNLRQAEQTRNSRVKIICREHQNEADQRQSKVMLERLKRCTRKQAAYLSGCKRAEFYLYELKWVSGTPSDAKK
jgi:hypothetical protein